MAEQEHRPARLQDVLNYTHEPYLSESEVSYIRSIFAGKKGNEIVSILRKIFLPTALDTNLPIEEMSSDIWMVDKDFSQVPSNEVKPLVLARQDAIKMVFGGLIKLKVIANSKEESEEQRKLRIKKDSLR